MTLVDMVGFSAAAASFVAFSAKTMIPLRIAAICSNVLFIAFGLLSGFWLAALMHTLLLPLNFIACKRCAAWSGASPLPRRPTISSSPSGCGPT